MLCPLCPELAAPEHIVTHMLQLHSQEVQAMGERIWQRQQQQGNCDLFSLMSSMQEPRLVQIVMGIKNAGVFSVGCSPLAAAALVHETQTGRMSLFTYADAVDYGVCHTVAPAGLKPVFAGDLETVSSGDKIARKELRAQTSYVPVFFGERAQFPGRTALCVRVIDQGKDCCRLWPVDVE